MDWLTLTGPVDDGRLQDLIRVATNYGDRKMKVHKWKRYGYEMQAPTEGVAVGQKGERILLQLSGLVADELYPLAGDSLPSTWKATRLDVRYDIRGKYAQEQFSAWTQQIEQKRNLLNGKTSTWQSPSQTETVYLHLNRSLTRVYKKHLERGDEVPWVRLELQYRQQEASSVFSSLLKGVAEGLEPSSMLPVLINTEGFTTMHAVRGAFQREKHTYRPGSDNLEWLVDVARPYILGRGISKEELLTIIYDGTNEDIERIEERVRTRKSPM